MTGRELEDLVDEERLDIDPRDFKEDEDLADAICKALDIDKPRSRRSADDDDDRPRSPRSRDDDDAPRSRRSSGDDEPDDKLAEMRRRRERD